MKRVLRNTERGIIGGVCAGISDYFYVDVVIIRLLFIVLLLSTFPAVLFYIILWIAIPSRKKFLDPSKYEDKY